MKILAGLAREAILLTILFSFSPMGCSNESTLEQPNSPCETDQGLYARITRDSSLTSFCVPDDRITNSAETGVHALYSEQSSSYMISASFTSNDTLHEIILSFKIQQLTPAVLIVTANEAAAEADPGAIWLYYRLEDLSSGGKAFQTITAAGTITVTFNDDQVAVATFQNIALNLGQIGNSAITISANIEEGYINVTSDPI